MAAQNLFNGLNKVIGELASLGVAWSRADDGAVGGIGAAYLAQSALYDGALDRSITAQLELTSRSAGWSSCR
jgi:hypothetical protein